MQSPSDEKRQDTYCIVIHLYFHVCHFHGLRKINEPKLFCPNHSSHHFYAKHLIWFVLAWLDSVSETRCHHFIALVSLADLIHNKVVVWEWLYATHMTDYIMILTHFTQIFCRNSYSLSSLPKIYHIVIQNKGKHYVSEEHFSQLAETRKTNKATLHTLCRQDIFKKWCLQLGRKKS